MLNVLVRVGGVDREKVTIIKEKETDTWCKVIHGAGAFSAKEPASLIVVGHSRACEQSWKRLCPFGFFCLALSS